MLAAGFAVLAATSLVAACGGDDKTSAEKKFCDAGDALRTDLTALQELDITAQGTSALRTNIDKIGDDVRALVDSGEDVAATEISNLRASVDALSAAVQRLADDPSVGSVGAVVAAARNVSATAQALYTKLDTTCS